MKSRASKIPTTVLERARVAAGSTTVKKPASDAASLTRLASKRPAAPARAKVKVIAALKKLHPMD